MMMKMFKKKYKKDQLISSFRKMYKFNKIK